MRREIEVRPTKENATVALVPGDVIVDAEELGQVASARMDVRDRDLVVYFMGGDCYKETFGLPQTLRVQRETGEPEYEWSGRPTGTHHLIEISKVGGGTVGRRYSGRWEYRVTVRGRVISEGADLNAGLPKTHKEMADALWEFLDDTE